MPAVILAVDQGSSSSRCVVLDARLAPIAVASRTLASAFPAPDRVEHDAMEILAGAAGAIGDALGLAGADWADVAGIGLAAQTETFVVWDRATGQPIYPAISWRDTRTSQACRRLRADGHEADITARTGLPLEPAFSASKLSWLLAQIPGASRAAASGALAFGDVSCWLIWQLSGGAVHVTDPSMAARTMLFNLSTGEWDADLLELFGVPEQMLPAVVPTAGQLAVTDAAVCGGRAALTASVGDQQAALFGQRCWRQGMAKLTLGTGAFLWCHAGTSRPACAPTGVISTCAWRLGSETTYALEGFVPNAGGVTTWLRQLGVLPAGTWPRISAGALSNPASGPWCVPALFGLGTPHWTPAASAEIGGLTAQSTGADLAQAALIGVVHQVVDAIEAVQGGLDSPLGVVRVDGGLGRNDSVLQAIADLSGLALQRPATAEVTALGAGALAGLGAGQWDLAALATVAFEPGLSTVPGLPERARQAARAGWRTVLAQSAARWQAAAGPVGTTP
jgi:glycerol kinase